MGYLHAESLSVRSPLEALETAPHQVAPCPDQKGTAMRLRRESCGWISTNADSTGPTKSVRSTVQSRSDQTPRYRAAARRNWTSALQAPAWTVSRPPRRIARDLASRAPTVWRLFGSRPHADTSGHS